tara:strand:+ start:1173 stop:1592 length:420 start_codon:yes stop_codon:yes gene_type:complete
MIHILKLSNGDTIVGDLISENEECITLNNPLELHMVNNPISGSGLMSVYWLPIDTEIFHVDIRQQHVIVLSEASTEIQIFYEKSLSNFIRKQHMIHQTLEDLVGLNDRRKVNSNIDDYDDMKQKMLLYAVNTANTDIMH